MPMDEFLLSLWKKALADAPLCFAATLAMGLMVWLASWNTFAKEGDVENVRLQVQNLKETSTNQYRAILLKIDLTTQEKIISDSERFMATARRELLQLNLADPSADMRLIVNDRISELESEIEEAQADIRQAEARISELRRQQDRLKAEGLVIVE